MVFPALWLACATPTPKAPTTECRPEPLEAGEVRARRIGCSDEILPSGEARQGDWLLENAVVRLAIRDATVSLTQLRGTGATLIDAALPGGTDSLVEAIPSVRGAWFETAEVEAWSEDDAAGLRIVGILPDGSEAEVGYTLYADEVALELSGMDGLTLVPMTNSEVVGQAVETQLDGEWVLFSVDGTIDDLGGWVRWTDPTVLHVGPRNKVHRSIWPESRWVSATSEGEWIHIVQDGQVTGRFPVLENAFAGWVPAELDGLQAVAGGSASGPIRAAQGAKHYELGDRGAIQLWVTDQDENALPATLRWNGIDYPWLPGDGDLLVGPGLGSGVVHAGPAYDTVEIPEQTLSGTASLEVQLTRQVGDALLARTNVIGSPDPTERRSSTRILHAEAAAGVRWAVLIADDEIPRVSLSGTTASWIHAQAGSRSGGTAGSPMTWPWSTDTDAPAHGATPWHLLGPLDMLDVMTKAGARQAEIDVGWIKAAGKAVGWGMRPETYRFDSMYELHIYVALLNHWLPLSPVGPWTWIEGIREEEASTTEAVRGILAGRTTATTGPRLVLTVDGTGPGEILPDSIFPTKRIRLRVEAAPGFEPTHAAVLTEAGELQRWAIERQGPVLLDVQTSVDSPDWVLAIAWSGGGVGPWAVSAPVWTGRP